MNEGEEGGTNPRNVNKHGLNRDPKLAGDEGGLFFIDCPDLGGFVSSTTNI